MIHHFHRRHQRRCIYVTCCLPVYSPPKDRVPDPLQCAQPTDELLFPCTECWDQLQLRRESNLESIRPECPLFDVIQTWKSYYCSLEMIVKDVKKEVWLRSKVKCVSTFFSVLISSATLGDESADTITNHNPTFRCCPSRSRSRSWKLKCVTE